jgi:hypothetical protein
MDNKPNYIDLGLSCSMGVELRELVETHLLQDLKNYGIDQSNLKFDWSDSCIEGHGSSFLDGRLENYSGIVVYDQSDRLVADGWMEFVQEGDFFIAYWEFIGTFDNQRIVGQKEEPGIPEHIWVQLPDDIKPRYLKYKMV